jgi:hypothetical protein
MKTTIHSALLVLAMTLSVGALSAADHTSVLSHKIEITPEIKKAFQGSDGIEIKEITGTSAKFQVGETYRVVGVCRQSSLKHAQLYLGNTAEAGSDAIRANSGSSLFKSLEGPSTDFDITFTVFRPGILHVTIYNMDNHNKTNNSYEGLYLGDVVYKH